MSEIADILDRAADLIEPRGAWTKGELARDKSGLPVSEHSPDAVCWCMSGAIIRATGEFDRHVFEAVEAVVGDLIPWWNDRSRRRKGEVVAALREAAAKARGGQP